MENIDQLKDRPSGIALCPKDDCLPRGISQYADVASQPRQQLPPLLQQSWSAIFAIRSLQLRYPADVAGPASFQ